MFKTFLDMKRLFLSLLALAAFSAAYAQSDSLAFFNGKWVESEPAEGYLLKLCQFEGDNSLFGANEFVSILEVKGHRIDIVCAERDTLARTSAMALREGASAAINGSFYRMRPPYVSENYLRVDYSLVDDNPKSSTSREYRREGAVATLHGELYIVMGNGSRGWESYIEAEDVLSTGPMLILDGEEVEQVAESFNTNRHPRTAIGKRADGTVVMVVVDGRNKMSAGASMTELRSIMRWLGCRDAINLDGGGSSTMWIGGEVVNHPSDNGRFDAEGERSVQNAIVAR